MRKAHGTCRFENDVAPHPEAPAALKNPHSSANPTDATTEQMLHGIGANCLVQIRRNGANVAGSADPESLHQLRIGLTRMGLVLRLCNANFGETEKLDDDLNWLIKQLGRSRDWDVLLKSIRSLASISAFDGDAFDPLRRVAAAKADDGHAMASAVLQSPRYLALLSDLTAWCKVSQGQHGISRYFDSTWDDGNPSFLFAEFLIHNEHLMLEQGHGLKKASAHARHRLRATVKAARYSTEFFQIFYRGRRCRRYLRLLKKLQEQLGRLHDASVAPKLVQALRAAHPECRTSADLFLRHHIAAPTKLRHRLQRNWRKFRSTKRPLLRAHLGIQPTV